VIDWLPGSAQDSALMEVKTQELDGCFITQATSIFRAHLVDSVLRSLDCVLFSECARFCVCVERLLITRGSKKIETGEQQFETAEQPKFESNNNGLVMLGASIQLFQASF
jgi:hypothetical protein